MNSDDKIKLLENVPIESYSNPESEKIVTQTWAQVLTRNGVSSSSNSVLRSVMSNDWKKVVDQTIKQYEDMQVPYRWVLGPSARPLELARCWELPNHQLLWHRKSVLQRLSNVENRFIPFVAFLGDQPVGTGGVSVLSNGAYLVEGAVDKHYRGQGIYKALLSYRARFANQNNLENLFVFAKKQTSAPICEKLGFETVFNQLVYSKELPSN